jgi:hypothetical protein
MPFPFSVCTNKGKLPFSTSSVFGVTETLGHGHGDSGDMETWRHGNMETWKHREIGTWRHGDIETWRHGVIETWTWRQGDIKQKTENGSVRYHCGGWSEELNSRILLLAYMVYL